MQSYVDSPPPPPPPPLFFFFFLSDFATSNFSRSDGPALLVFEYFFGRASAGGESKIKSHARIQRYKVISTNIGPCDATVRTFIHSARIGRYAIVERKMAHHDLHHVAERQQETPSAMRKNSNRHQH